MAGGDYFREGHAGVRNMNYNLDMKTTKEDNMEYGNKETIGRGIPGVRIVKSHTPTPWKFEKETSTIRSQKENYWLATMDSWDGAIDNEANAAFIVKAVNTHAELVDALRRVMARAEELAKSGMDTQAIVRMHDALRIGRTAINKVGE